MTASLILPVHNQLAPLQQVTGVVRGLDCELIVVDGGSRDGTLDHCLRERLIFISFPDWRGEILALNAGMKISSGETVVLLRAGQPARDDWLRMLNDSSALRQAGVIHGAGEGEFMMIHRSVVDTIGYLTEDGFDEYFNRARLAGYEVRNA